MYDALIIGGRCAGSPTGMLLARKGHKVLIVDRASFPSDTLSTHFIQIPGMARLKRWGLLERLMETGCPPIRGGVLNIEGLPAEAEFPFPDGIPGMVSPRRTVLDKLLADAAVEAGAELREGVFIDSLIVEDGRVVGAKGHSPEGPFEERAKVVVGADGRNSVVARDTGAATKEHVPALGCGYYAYFSGMPCERAELYLFADRFAVAFPTHDGLTTVAIGYPPAEFANVRRDPLQHLMESADSIGDLGTRMRAGELAGKVVGMADVPNYLRTAQGPGWALVGDAAYNKDPSPADGMTDAFRGADLLAEALDDYFSGRKTEEDALSGYDEQHEKAARPLLEQTLTMSSFENDPGTRATAFLELGGLHEQELNSILGSSEQRGAA
jgi:flavin-dependent dehydrogenase